MLTDGASTPTGFVYNLVLLASNHLKRFKEQVVTCASTFL